MRAFRWIVFAWSIAFLCPLLHGGQLTEEQKQWLARASRHEKEGWTYLHVEGSPVVRGFQHGYLLAKEIDSSLISTRGIWTYKTSMPWAWLVKRSSAFLIPGIDAELLAEIDGIVKGLSAAGVKTTRAELVAYNAIIELQGYWWPQEVKKLNRDADSKSPQSCSSFIATGSMTADGGIVLGHNTMSGFAGADLNVIIDIVPERGHRIMMQICPGWIHSGSDFFITDAGLVGSETTIGNYSGFREKGTPEFVRMRRATQDAGSLDEWVAIMKKGNNGGYANAWLVGDIKTGEILRLEIGLSYIGLERTKDGFFTGSNVAENLKILRLETTHHETDIRLSSIARRVRWQQLMRENKGRIDIGLAEKFEADHYDSFLKTDSPGGRSLCGHFELDSLAIGSDPPFSPEGTVDAKVVDTKLAKEMSFVARWGSACGRAFSASEFLDAHPQYDWMKEYLRDRPSRAWAVFKAGE